MIGKNTGTLKSYKAMDLIAEGWSWNSTTTKSIQSTRIL